MGERSFLWSRRKLTWSFACTAECSRTGMFTRPKVSAPDQMGRMLDVGCWMLGCWTVDVGSGWRPSSGIQDPHQHPLCYQQRVHTRMWKTAAFRQELDTAWGR